MNDGILATAGVIEGFLAAWRDPHAWPAASIAATITAGASPPEG